MILAAVIAASALAGEPIVWRWAEGRVTPDEGAETPRAVGSLQKAWVLRAWAETHADPSTPPPRLTCDRASRCWVASGHGDVSLRRATALSCNAYFRRLGEETPEAARRQAFLTAGFDVPEPLSPEAALGLDAGGEAVRITPRRLLAAYASLVTTPWTERDDLRREWLDGMRDAAEDGTASGLPLRGLLAKTGTVAAVDGTPLRVSGWAIVLDPAGRSGALALLPRGTGAEAARALGAILARESPSGTVRESAVPRTPARPHSVPRRAARPIETGAEVRVRLFVAFRGPEVTARNVSSAPLHRESGGAGDRWVGPAVLVTLEAGQRLEAGLWELDLPRTGLVRLVKGALERGPGGSVVLTTSLRDYAEGVLRGEMPHGDRALKEELAATVLRFLARGARHAGEDVCDLSHCARFAGFGPELTWRNPTTAVVSGPSGPGLPEPALDDAAWDRVLAAAHLPGPYAFSSHCGGEPLSPHAVWGTGDREATPCPRHHGEGASARWQRTWKDADLAAVFRSTVISLAAVERDGVRKTVVTTGPPSDPAERVLLYDELHSLVATRLGWSALPSPPDGFTRVAGGWRVSGRGSGHRVGLCLAD